MPTGVFNPFKLTDRSVIIGSLVLLTAVMFIILQRLFHLSKQCRPLLDIISFTIFLLSTLYHHFVSISFIWVLGIIGLLK